MKKRIWFAALITVMLCIPSFTLVAEEDEHFIQTDDFFISREAFKNQDYIYVNLAKLTQEPTKETKQEGQFMQVVDGKTVWTKNYYETRVATPEDLKIGTIVIVAEITDSDEVYRAPENKDEARTCSWFMAKITDVSDLYKNIATVSGGYKVNDDAFRVIVPPKK